MSNAAQQSFSSNGLDAASILAVREKIATSIGNVITDFQKETDAEKRKDLVIKMYSVCIANDITAGN